MLKFYPQFPRFPLEMPGTLTPHLVTTTKKLLAFSDSDFSTETLVLIFVIAAILGLWRHDDIVWFDTHSL